jgi:cell division transport system ATP-binding protein
MDFDSSILITNATIYQRETHVLTSVDLKIKPGEFVYLVGRVGSGKSSLIKTLNAEIPLYEGEIQVAGYQLGHLKTKEISSLRRKLGVVFQDFKLLTDRSVYNNLLFVLKATGWDDKVAMAQRIDDLLGEVGMLDKKDKMPFQLSGGEQQRVVIARALLNDPEIILADEPTGNLDQDTSVEILKLFQKINKEGKTILMATHDKLIIDQFPNRTLVCENGSVVERGNDELINFRQLLD